MAIDTNSTNVILIGAKDNVFKDIIDAINGLSGQVEDNGIANNNNSRGRRDQENANEHRRLAASVAAERKQRAAANAINGKIDKAMSTMDVFKKMVSSAFETLGDLVKDGFKQSLKSYDDFAKSMREINISHDDKLAAQSAADRANIADGFRVSKDSVTKALEFTAKNNNAYFQKLVNSNTKESQQRLNIMGEMSEQGWDEATMMKLVTSTSDSKLNQLEALVLKTSDPASKAAALEIIRNQIGNDFESIASDVTGNLTGLVDATRNLTAIGSNISDKTISSFAKLSQDMKSNQLQNIDINTLNTVLGTIGDQAKNPEMLFKGLSSRLSEINELSKVDRVAAEKQSKQFISNLVPILNSGNVDKDAIQEIMQAASQAAAGQLADVKIAGEGDLRERDKDNTPDGKLNSLIGNLTSKINIFTEDALGVKGGLLGSLSTNLDELFGGDLSMEKVVSSGFKATLELLDTIHLTQLAQGITNMFSGGNIFGKLGKFGKGAGAASAAGTGAGAASAAGTGANAASAAGIGTRLARVVGSLSKFTKVLGTAGIVIGGAASLYSMATEKDRKVSTELSSKEFKKEEAKLNKQTKAIKVAGIAAQVGVGLAGMKAGAAAGAAIGSVIPGAGTAIGAAIGLAVGGIGAVVVHDIVKGIEQSNLHDIEIKGIGDLVNQVSIYKEMIAKETDPVRAAELKSQLAVIEKSITDKKSEFIQNTSEEHNKRQSDEASLTREIFLKLKPKLDADRKEEAAILEKQKKYGNLSPKEKNDLDKLQADIKNTKYAMHASATRDGYGIYAKEGESVDDYIKRASDKVISQSGGAIKGQNIYSDDDSKFLRGVESVNVDTTMYELTKGWNDTIDVIEDIPMEQVIDLLKNIAKNNGLTNVGTSELIKRAMESADREEEFEDYQKNNPQQIELAAKALGGIIKNPTAALVGESGKEAILPLTKQGALRNVLLALNNNEKRSILETLLNSPGMSLVKLIDDMISVSKSSSQQSAQNNSVSGGGVPGDDPATINKILGYAGNARDLVYDKMLYGWKGNYKNGFKQREKWYDEAKQNAANQTGRELIAGTYAEKALDFGVSELGKPYILRSLGKLGYVCNELVNACLQASGFDMQKFRVHGVGATFANIAKGKHSDGKSYPDFRIRTDLTPQTATPGMIFFQDSKKDMEGFQPGHIGFVYYGNQKLHSAGGSANYTKEGFLQNWQTPCRGVTVTPFDNNKYVIGELPGLFEQTNGTFGQTTSSQTLAKNVGLLTNEEINSLAKEAGLQNASAMTEFVKQAEILLNSNTNTDKNSVIAILMEIAKCLKGSVASKQPMMSVARNVTSVYGQ